MRKFERQQPKRIAVKTYELPREGKRWVEGRPSDSNGWARLRRARYFRGFARGDTSIGVAIFRRA